MLSAYLARIGRTGPVAPTRAGLDAVIAGHLAHIPFENFDPLCGIVPDLAPEAIAAKLIDRKRGGYCFEQNALLRDALRAMGFSVETLIARVWWQKPADMPPGPWSHMALRVRIGDTDLLADAGFGGCVPPQSLDMALRTPQATAHETYRFRDVPRAWMLDARVKDEWAPVYEIRHTTADDAEYAAANHLTATASFFATEVTLSRTTPDERIAIKHNRLTRRGPEGIRDQHVLAPEALAQTIAAHLGLAVAPEWLPILARAAKTEPAQ
ncbi:arylamine N-acetyltransferase family protein [Mesobacterium pallidum]|uniref:arylamine N-acetyltransferase family protein n=1 Tax=Mesobacterium pallidum TaxID=2872037 RepID=UPI001EE1FE7F|nr:arylamine N-acetyltransferase [Mesobacterium pallidum]